LERAENASAPHGASDDRESRDQQREAAMMKDDSSPGLEHGILHG
jgi:hypothetical protein